MSPLPVFVYGTLRSDGSQAGMLAGLARRAARVRGELWHLPAGYPALRLAGDGWVEGELVDAPDPQRLALLDHYEGVDEGLYTREVVSVIVALEKVQAWAWVMEAPGRRGGIWIPDGRWRVVRRR